MKRQALNVARMRFLGAEVVPVTAGQATLKEAVKRNPIAGITYGHEDIQAPGAPVRPIALSHTTSAAHATGGYYSGNKGARASGRAGAFTARADDLTAVTYNPAGVGRLDGWVLQVGNRFSYNAHAYRRAPTLDWGADGVPPYVEFDTVENDTFARAYERARSG